MPAKTSTVAALAPAQLGVSQSALSHTVRGLEKRLGLRLMSRTTRWVAPTEAGERILATVAPCFEEIETQLSALSELRDSPARTVRITTTDDAANAVLIPRQAKVAAAYPGLKIEIAVDFGMTDIVTHRLDIGVRWGDQVAKDMIAARISPDMQMAVVGSPDYFQARDQPQSPQELLSHNCITLRLACSDGIYAWELSQNGRDTQVRVDGQLVCNGAYQMLEGAMAGMGLAFLPMSMVEEPVRAGRLVGVLQSWCPSFPGLHIFYLSCRQSSRALRVVMDALRLREEGLMVPPARA